MEKKNKLTSFIITIVFFEIAFLIGLAFLINEWWIVGSAIIFISFAPLEQYYLETL